MAEPTEDTKPGDADRISLRVVAQDGGEVFFKIRRSTPLSKLIKAYCEKKGLAPNSVRFLFDGQRISDEHTPDSLQMENDDVIDALLQQTGGL
ncbi:MAG: small ubiquitin-related modifier [archaeon]|nr:small ubiquitin-related modifier [archaeon]